MIKRLIFDIDGTLIRNINFEPFIREALRIYGIEDLKKTKIFLNHIKEYETLYNTYDKNLYLNFFSKQLGVSLEQSFLNILLENLKKEIPNNCLELQNTLKALKDYELVLLSNYFEESQRNRLKAMNINHFFPEYYGEKVIKPNTLSYINAIKNHPCKECLIIGDDKKLDIDIPKSLGIKTLYVNENGDIKKVEELTPQLIRKL